MDLIGFSAGKPQSLAQRNLLRHLTFKIPSGQAVAKAMKLPVLHESELYDLAEHGLNKRTPLWFYILREAETTQSGERLGAVSARIVADVFIGLMQGDPTSYLRQDVSWVPSLPSAAGAGKFAMTDLLQFARVVPRYEAARMAFRPRRKACFRNYSASRFAPSRLWGKVGMGVYAGGHQV